MSHGEIRPVCPHARLVQGATPEDAGVICGAMEKDQARKDRILEGAPVGVFIRLRDDPSTLRNLCCGTAAPSPDPDTPVAHYSSCPIYLADAEVSAAERMYAPQPAPGFAPDPQLITGVDGALEWERAMKEAGELDPVQSLTERRGW